jgi:voltage-dependent calcium channel L type alpha-1D
MTVINILPSISNIMALFALVLFIYACVAINLFSGTKLIENIDDKNNFQTFGNAMLVLMRFATGEDWNAFMYEYANKENCTVSILIFLV